MRKFFLLSIALFSCAAWAGSAAEKTPAYFIRGALPSGKIHLPVEFQKPVLLAATELRQFIAEISGAEFTIAWGAPERTGAAFILRVRPPGEWKGRECAQRFSIVQTMTPPRVTITGNSNLAVLYGTYEYLESIGVRFLSPEENGINLPESRDIPLTPGTVSMEPKFKKRVFSLSSVKDNHFGGSDIPVALRRYQLFLLRNRAMLSRFAGADFDFGHNPAIAGHYIKPMTGLTNDLVKKGLMNEKPERFALVTDRRTHEQKRIYNGGQVCFSNQENFDHAVANAKKYIERFKAEAHELDELRTVPFGLSDCEGVCECENCKKIGGDDQHWRDRLVWDFWNRIAREVDKMDTGRCISNSSPYLSLRYPPDDVVAEKNIITGSAWVYQWELGTDKYYPFSDSYYDELSKISAKGVKRSFYCYTNFPWAPTPIFILDVLPRLEELKIDLFEIECMCRAPYIWPIIRAAAKATWEGQETPREYLRQTCEEMFGGEFGGGFYDFYVEMTENAKKMQRINFGSAADGAYMFPPEMIAKYRPFFRNALHKSSGQHKSRIDDFRKAIEAAFMTADMYRAFVEAYNTRTKEAIENFNAKANAVKNAWEKNRLVKICSSDRNPRQLAEFFQRTDFQNLLPRADSMLSGKGADDIEIRREVFAGVELPANLANFTLLPEVWRLHVEVPGIPEEHDLTAPELSDTPAFQDISTWNALCGQGVHSQIGGLLTYRLTFKAPLFPEAQRVYLRVGAVDDSGEFYLNGKHIGGSRDPRDWNKSFEMEITDVIKQGQENVIAARVYDCGGAEGIWKPQALYTK